MKLKTLLSTAILLITANLSWGQILYEKFDYTAGAFVGGDAGITLNNWTTHSGTGNIVVGTGSLSYTGLATSAGNKITIPGLTSVSKDINRAITTTSTTIYYSALIKVLDNTALTTSENYFMALGGTDGASVTSLAARLGAKLGTTSGFRLSILNMSGGTPVYTDCGQDLAFGTTYLVVVKYDKAATPNVASFWVNPATLGGAEPNPTATNATGTTVLADFKSIVIRNSIVAGPPAAGTPNAEIDEIRVGTTFAEVTPVGGGADTQAPTATFVPATAATGVAINSPITITFDEAIRNIDNSEITNANVASLLSLKEKVSGNAVTFTASIDATKKVITITPSANLTNSLQYEVGIAPVEDAADNATTTIASTFTTIGTSVITLTAPNGGEKFYAGQTVDFTWTSTGMDAENIKIEAYVYNNGSASWNWTECIASTANDGSASYTIPADAAYGTQYKIRITGLTSATTDESNASFTVIATTDNLATLIGLPANSIVKYTGKATVTYARTARNQKYIQDANAAVLIDDATTAPGYITDAYAIGEGISNIEGKITLYNSLVELVPQATTGEKVTGNPTIAPEVRTIASLTHADQCKLVKIEGLTITTPTQYDAGGLFVASKNYDVTGFANTAFVFRTAFSEANYIGTAVPATAQNVVGLVGQFNAVMQISPRNLADITPVTGINDNDAVSTKAYPNPFSTDFKINAGKVVRNVVVSNMLGQKVMERAYNEIEIEVPASDLRTGVYFVTVKFEDGTTSTLRMVKK